MKIAESLMSIFIGITIAWFILNMPKVSTFTLDPAPLEYDDSNLALVGAGLATQAPQPPSVMDADTGPDPSVVLMNSSPATPMSPAPLTLSSGGTPAPPVTVVNPPTSMAPVYGMASPAASPDVVMPTPMAPPVATSFTPMMPPSPSS